MCVEACERRGVEAIVGAILPKLGAVEVGLCDTEEGEEGDGEAELEAEEDVVRPHVGAGIFERETSCWCECGCCRLLLSHFGSRRYWRRRCHSTVRATKMRGLTRSR